jgi:hypothetical protein
MMLAVGFGDMQKTSIGCECWPGSTHIINRMTRVVVIGGLGNFGARICSRLAPDPRFKVIATGRRVSNAEHSRDIQVATLDTGNPGFGSDLQSLAPDLVIHCAGPFQGQDYRVALASVACGAHYVDLADGREFVTGFVHAVGPAAEAAECLAVTGASTLPALSSAVVDYLASSFSSLDSIDIVIAPGQHARRGAATVTAVLGYAGQAVPWWQRGEWCTAYGWQDLKRERFSFGNRLAAACDVPDLELLPRRYAGVKSVSFRAALEVSLQHYVLWLMGACRRIGLPLPLVRLGAPMDRVGTWLNWLGSDTGGMMVRVSGTNSGGQPQCRTWELVAKSNHGPEIPCMAAVLVAERLNGNDSTLRGAKICMGILGLSDFEPEFGRWDISTRIFDTTP